MNLSSKIFYLILPIVLPLLFLTGCDSVPEEQEHVNERPNIIFIMTDDQANRTVSAYGGSINHTPNIDRLAEDGALFLNSFVGNSICGPSRATIMTGVHSHKHGVVGNASPWDGTQTSLLNLLQGAGYTTALIGKWHLNNPPADEFDYKHWLIGAGLQGFYYNPDFITNTVDTITVEGHATDLITDKALEWLEESAVDAEDPFLMFVHYKAPHVPRMPEFRFLDRYVDETIPEPETLYDDYATREPYAAEANMGFNYRPLPPFEEHDPSDDIYYERMTPEQLERWHSYKDPEVEKYRELYEAGELEGDGLRRFSYQKFIKDYLRIIDGVDENVGRLLDWLDEHPDLNDNTIVVFTSDQGYFTGEHGWAEKRFIYEESLKMPLLMRWPAQIEPGLEIEPLVHNIDFAPTFLEAAGVEVPEEMQGRSFIPLLQGDEIAGWRENIYYHYYDHGLHNVPRHDGIRNHRFKLVNFYTDDAWEFYDLEDDPYEVNNRYGSEEFEEILQRLKSDLEQLRNEYEVPEHHFQPPYVQAGQDQQL